MLSSDPEGGCSRLWVKLQNLQNYIIFSDSMFLPSEFNIRGTEVWTICGDNVNLKLIT